MDKPEEVIFVRLDSIGRAGVARGATPGEETANGADLSEEG